MERVAVPVGERIGVTTATGGRDAIEILKEINRVTAESINQEWENQVFNE